MNDFSTGCDIEKNERFENKTLENDKRFLEKIFSKDELNYCFSKARPCEHLCARFCAKEAVVKALYAFKIKDIFYKDIEIKKNDDGLPYVDIKKYPDLKVKISLSHSIEYSMAVAIISKNT